MQYSTEQAARIVQTLSFLLAFFGKTLPVEAEQLTLVIAGILFAGSTIYGWVRRYRKGDLKLSGVRK